MVAEVSTVVRLMKGSGVSNNESSSSSSSALTTRDLLGDGGTIDSKELDLDLQVPSGWEKHLDLKSGEVYLERSNYWTSSSSTTLKDMNKQIIASKPLTEDTKLELKLQPSSSSSSGNHYYHSVFCTLDKVKSALEKEASTRKRKICSISSSSSNYSNSSISTINIIKTTTDDEDMRMSSSNSNNSLAAGCPTCLIYVLTSKTNPRCPRCNTIILPVLPHNVPIKKPRIDLNISIY